MRKQNLTVSLDEAYEHARRQALELMDWGFHLRGVIRNTREEWHEGERISRGRIENLAAQLP